jgi:hypothetical protein
MSSPADGVVGLRVGREIVACIRPDDRDGLHERLRFELLASPYHGEISDSLIERLVRQIEES